MCYISGTPPPALHPVAMTEHLSDQEVHQLALRAGAVPPDNQPFDPRASIPLLFRKAKKSRKCRIEGPRKYLRLLSDATYDLHRHLQKAIPASSAGQVMARGQSLGKLPNLTKPMLQDTEGCWKPCFTLSRMWLRLPCSRMDVGRHVWSCRLIELPTIKIISRGL